MGQHFTGILRGSVGLLGSVLCGGVLSASEAPRGNPWPSSWAAGGKEAFGTAFEAYDEDGAYSARSATAPISRVWFTVAQGVASEIYWPTLDRKQIRDIQYLVSDGKEFFFEERTQSVARVTWIEKGVPAFKIVTGDRHSQFEIEKLLFTDPDRDTFVMKTRFRALKPGLKLYVLINPSVANTPFGDSASADSATLAAWQDRDAMALVSSVGYRKSSAGHSGSLDPFQDLARDMNFDNIYTHAIDGNVVMMGEINIPDEVGDYNFNLALGFGDNVSQAREIALASLAGVDAALLRYVEQWRAYQGTLFQPKKVTAPSSELYWSSVAVLKSLEDKTFPGAFIASPSIPWGLLKIDNSSRAAPRQETMTRSQVPESQKSQGIGGYHLVWPRDLYQMAESFLALGDVNSAKASLKYLQQIQYTEQDGVWNFDHRRFSKKGSFLQNSWLHGEAHWTMLQIDQTAYPILLALKLWRAGVVDFEEIRELVTSAADFIEENGPWTSQERWEENMGIAPSTLAVQIAALREASQAFWALKDAARAERYGRRAAEWESRVETWTFTHTGTVGNGRYYLRIVGTEHPGSAWDPNSFMNIRITNGGPTLLEKSVLDGGFLELVRYGVRRAWDASVRSTLDAYDAVLKSSTSRGEGFRRYTGDAYNWDERSGEQTAGMIWPFLSGERAQYELAALKDRADQMSAEGLKSTYEARVMSHVRSFEAFATPSAMFPEQVWDSGARQGQATGAATPLGWAHGEYVRLVRDLDRFEAESLPSKGR